MAFDSDPRPLSPITESITPNTLQTRRSLPLVDTAHISYDSEHEAGAPSPVNSVYSQGSADTITQRTAITTTATSTVDAAPPIAVPEIPSRSPHRPLTASRSSSPHSSISPPPGTLYPFPSAPSPGGLPPPPRPRSGSVKRFTPPPTPSLIGNDEARKRVERYFNGEGGSGKETPTRSRLSRLSRETLARDEADQEDEEQAGMAGVGAGGTLKRHTMSRPGSFNTAPDRVPQPGDIVAQTPAHGIQPTTTPPDDTLPNVPVLRVPLPSDIALPESTQSSPQKSPPKLSPSNFTGSRPSSRQGSRPNSLTKRRPSSFSGSRSSTQSRPSSFHEGMMGETSGEYRTGVDPEITNDTTSPTTRRPGLTSRQSDSFLPTTTSSPSDTAGQAVDPKFPPHRRIVSSIFSSLFGSDSSQSNNGHHSDSLTRKLSKRARKTSSRISGTSEMATAGSSPHDKLDDLDSIGRDMELQTAIRTSGTFGIRDDGSDLYEHGAQLDSASTRSPRPSRIRTKGGNESILSDATRRVLYVNNRDVSVAEDEEPTPRPSPSKGRFDSGKMKSREIGESTEVFYTPVGVGSPVTAVSELSRGDGGEIGGGVDEGRAMDGRDVDAEENDEAVETERDFGTIGSVKQSRRQSYSPPTALSAIYVPLGRPIPRDRPPTPPPSQPSSTSPEKRRVLLPRGHVTPTPTDHPSSNDSHSPRRQLFPKAGGTVGEMVSQGDSSQLPLPYPPGIPPRRASIASSSAQEYHAALEREKHREHGATSPHTPRLHFPPPPSATPSPNLPHHSHPRHLGTPPPQVPGTIPAGDLPLLIASHLLSTHAAALMRHSTGMRDVSEIMHQMAKESLDWGGVLLGMSARGDGPSSLSNSAFPQGTRQGDVLTGSHRPGGVSMEQGITRSSGGMDGLPGAIDPLEQAWMNLHGSRPLSMFDSASRPPLDSSHPFANPGPRLSDESPVESQDNFSPIPQRPSEVRTRTRVMSEIPSGAGGRRRKTESLPADLLRQADRLGREGWANLHRAEEAWGTAMDSLRELVESEGYLPRQHVGDEGEEQPFESSDGPKHVYGHGYGRMRRASMDIVPPSPHRSHGHREVTYDDRTSFLPRDSDMMDGVYRDCNTDDMNKASKILGPHAGVIPTMASIPIMPQSTDSASHSQPSQQDYQPALQPPNEELGSEQSSGYLGPTGYTGQHLGGDTMQTTKSDRPGSRMTNVSGSQVSHATASTKGGGGRKLRKKPGAVDVPPVPARIQGEQLGVTLIPRPLGGGATSTFRSNEESGVVESVGENKKATAAEAIEVKGGGMKERKKYWWSRRRGSSLGLGSRA